MEHTTDSRQATQSVDQAFIEALSADQKITLKDLDIVVEEHQVVGATGSGSVIRRDRVDTGH